MRMTLALLTTALAACASPPHECTITSEPPGAAFQLGEHAGKTPATIELASSRHRLAFNAGLKGYANASLDVLPKSGVYPAGLHITFAKPGEGITTVAVKRRREKPILWSRRPANAPVDDDGDTYWLR